MTDFIADRRQQLREDGLEALGVIVRTIRSHIDRVHRLAWEGKGPIDRKEGEQRPAWLK